MSRVLNYISERPWAITEAALENILTIANRENPSLEAVAAQIGKPLENTRDVEMRGSTAIIPVSGPIFRYANLFTAISGATSVEVLATDFATALADPAVKAILLTIDSPGGEVTGINELAKMIAAADKPVIAYVGGMAASAAYWLASAADQIVMDETAHVGSIGVVATFRDTSARDEKAGVKTIEIVSSQSPHKRPDIASDAGRAQILEMVDGLADVFVRTVAENRGVSVETVLADFGKGKLVSAANAVTAGMADRLASYEELLNEMDQPGDDDAAAGSASFVQFGARSAANIPERKTTMSTTAKPAAEQPQAAPPVDLTALKAETVNSERTRINAILACDEAKDRGDLARTLAMITDLTADQAKAILAAAPKAAAAVATAAPAANALAAAMQNVPNPNVGVDGATADKDTPEALAALILKAGR